MEIIDFTFNFFFIVVTALNLKFAKYSGKRKKKKFKCLETTIVLFVFASICNVKREWRDVIRMVWDKKKRIVIVVEVRLSEKMERMKKNRELN